MNTAQKIELETNTVQNDGKISGPSDCDKYTDQAKDYRCPLCKRLLMKGKIIVIETKCPRCKKHIQIRDYYSDC